MCCHMLCTPTRYKLSPAGAKASPRHLSCTSWGRTTAATGAYRGNRKQTSLSETHECCSAMKHFQKKNPNIFVSDVFWYLAVWPCLFWVTHPAVLVPKERNVMIWTLWTEMAAPVSARKSPSSTVLVSHIRCCQCYDSNPFLYLTCLNALNAKLSHK